MVFSIYKALKSVSMSGMSLKDREEGFFTPLGIVQIVGFVFSVVLVGMFYSLIVRPSAEKYAVAQEYGVTEQLGSQGNFFVIIRDYEQQACFTLMVWVLLILGYKYILVNSEKQVLLREERLLDEGGGAELIADTEDHHIYIEDADRLVTNIEQVEQANNDYQGKLLPYLLTKGLQRFVISRSIQESSDIIKGRIDNIAERLDSELSIIRYIAWAIPSIGFIGTVRGIGEGLAHADQALEGDISGVTSSLGLAFNSTLVALFISIFLMFFIHSLQSRQEGIVLALETFCREHLIDRLRIGQRPEPQAAEEITAAGDTEAHEPQEA